MFKDIQYGFRMILKSPGFTLLAMLALALGICANSTIFSFINGMLLRPLTGVTLPDRLVTVYTSDFSSGLYSGSSYPDFLDFRAQADSLEGLAAFENTVLNFAGTDGAERLRGTYVTGNFFEVLGVKATIGRTLQPADDSPTGSTPVVISNALWQRLFSSDQSVVGKPVKLNNKTYTVVGVAAETFRGLQMGAPPELWLPMSAEPAYAAGARGDRGIQLIGRLAQSSSLSQAQAQLTTIAARLAQAYPETNLGTLAQPKEPRPVTVVQAARINPRGQQNFRFLSVLLLVVVGLVLLIACANVANLLLARASARRREIAIRLSLGASRGRLIRQLLTESILLSLLGGVVGLLLTQWTANSLTSFFPPDDIVGLDLSVDWRVMVFTLGVTLLTGVLFGLAPALQATRANLVSSLKDTSAGSRFRVHRFALRDVLVVSQLALSLVLLVGAGLFVRSLQHALDFDPGFASQNLVIASLETGGSGLTREQGPSFYRDVIERARTIPGVEAATLSAVVPISGGGQRRNAQLESYQAQPNEDTEINTNVVGSDYFNTMKISIVSGRDFTSQDRAGAPGVVIVNEELSRRYFNQNALGKRIRLSSDGPQLEVVGIVRTAKYRDLREDPLPFIYIPLGQEYNSGMALMVRTSGDPLALVPGLRSEIRSLNKDVPVFAVETMSQRIGDQLAPERMIAVLLSVFGGAALFLAAIGIYGVMGYSVAQRTHEIGIRMALGAKRSDILRLVVRQGLVLTLIGVGVGLVLAVISTRVLKTLLFGISPNDPLTFGAIVLLLGGVSVLACYLPARRATRVDPLVALRYE
jgi:predicted permease